MMISDSDQIYLAVYVLCIVGILCILLHLLYMLNKEKIKIYIFSKSWGKKIFCSEEVKLDENKPFDAFISYSHHDANFVEEILLPGLESDPKEVQYKCLIHTRDWKVGFPISEQIIESVDCSRRTIIVHSVDYIQSEWTRLEFQTAHKKSMEENTQVKIIFINFLI